VRVVDPLGGEDEEDLDDLIASWEVAEEEINAATVADVTVAADASAEETELNVTAAFLAEQQSKAFAARQGETGIRPGGLNVPKELFGDGVIKQKAKLREMNATGYKQPLDFAELAEKRLSRELIEMPMATKSFYLDVGGSAKDSPFTAFSFQNGNTEIAPAAPKWNTLAQLASNFAGTKYDLNNPAHRKQMRMRLLRMFNQRAKPILKELADAYYQKFNRPLRVTSLTRSMDYQIGLNATNANSFKVRGEGSLPPHTSGGLGETSDQTFERNGGRRWRAFLCASAANLSKPCRKRREFYRPTTSEIGRKWAGVWRWQRRFRREIFCRRRGGFEKIPEEKRAARFSNLHAPACFVEFDCARNFRTRFRAGQRN
jgi:hypothetical protein